MKDEAQALVWLGGKVVPAAEAKVSVFDRGFLFGDGVYETGRSYDGCFLFLEEHWKRLRSSAGKLHLPVPWTDEALTAGLSAVGKQFGKPNLYFRTIISRGVVDYVGLDMPAAEPTLVHILQNLSPATDKKREKGMHLITAAVQRNSALAQDPNIKTSNYLNSLLAMQDARARGGEDAVMCDPFGNVAEGTTFSIFGVTAKDKVITPTLKVGILDSITRRHVIQIARKKYDVEEGEIQLSEFQRCREVFIVSSLREVMPVRQWDDHQYPVGGPVTKALHAALKEVIREYVATHAKY